MFSKCCFKESLLYHHHLLSSTCCLILQASAHSDNNSLQKQTYLKRVYHVLSVDAFAHRLCTESHRSADSPIFQLSGLKSLKVFYTLEVDGI